MKQRDTTVKALGRMQTGAVRGLRTGAVLGIISLVINLLIENAAYDRFGVSPVAATLAYVLGGTCGGAAVGLLRPLISNWLSAALIGAVAFLPAIISFRFARYGVGSWRLAEAGGICILALILGAIWGPPVWRQWKAETKSS